MAPWQLGLRTLKWGGLRRTPQPDLGGMARPKNLQLALLNGHVDAGRAGDRSLSGQHSHRAVGSARATAHRARIAGQGALQALAGLRRLATPDFLAGVESKWVAAATLHLHGQVADQGHAIYEEVQYAKKRKPNWGPWAYGALFTVVLPLLLAGWAWRLDGSGLAPLAVAFAGVDGRAADGSRPGLDGGCDA